MESNEDQAVFHFRFAVVVSNVVVAEFVPLVMNVSTILRIRSKFYRY